MKCAGWTETINEYADGELDASGAGEIETHLATCAECRAQLESLRALLARAASLEKETLPSRDLWARIEPALASRSDRSVGSDGSVRCASPRPMVHRPRFTGLWLLAAASIAVLLAIGGIWRWRTLAALPTWSVASLEGSPRVGARVFSGESRMRVGQWLETDSTSSARVAIGTIGQVDLDPNSRLRIVRADATDHRIELARGTLHAVITAPPRLFFVETPSATAIDLGCAYTLSVDDHGDGTLEVTSGYVALDGGKSETIVRAGMMCSMHPGSGAGTPYYKDAPPALKEALNRLDTGTQTALADVLLQARPAEDAMTLWHLLASVSGDRRGAVFDALARANPPPAGVTRAGIVDGDSTMLETWQADLDARHSSRIQNGIPISKKTGLQLKVPLPFAPPPPKAISP